MADPTASPVLTFDLPPNMDFSGLANNDEGRNVVQDATAAITPNKSLLSVLMKASFSMSSLRDGSPDTDASSVSSPATLPRRKRRDGRRRHVTPTMAQRIRHVNCDRQPLQSSDQSWSSHSTSTSTPLLNQLKLNEKRDEFWEALQSNYDYLMDGGLIETCKEANGDLSCDEDEDLEVRCTWTFKEFLDRYTELGDWLDDVRAALDQNQNTNDGVSGSKVVQSDETKYRSAQMKLFNEQSGRLERRYPNMRDEIASRTGHLNARWTELQGVLAIGDDDDAGDRDEMTALKGEIARQIRCLRKWLREVEEQVGPLTLNNEWNGDDDVRLRLRRQQALQHEIESRCKCVLAVVDLCEKLRRRYDESDAGTSSGSTVPLLPQQQQQQQQQVTSSSAAGGQTATTTGSTESRNKRKEECDRGADDDDGDLIYRRIKRIRGQRGCDHTVRVAQNLQRRFHALWIRSLEWQCWLEGLLANGSAYHQQQQHIWKECRSPGDEPKRKCPRLIGTFQSRNGNGNGNDMVVPCAGKTTTATTAGDDSSDAYPLKGSPMVTTGGVGGGGNGGTAAVVSTLPRGVGHHDHHDVGYSSESSAHLSNEDSAGEFVRVYTYTSAEATTPSVLEVVVDGEHRPRKTPPRDAQPCHTPVESAGSNCGTFYFCHEDSDGGAEHGGRTRAARTKLDFGLESAAGCTAPGGASEFYSNGSAGGHQARNDRPSSSPSSSSSPSNSSCEGDGENGAGAGAGATESNRSSFLYSKGIHRLVKQAEMLVKPSYNEDGRNFSDQAAGRLQLPPLRRQRASNAADGHCSSCDASGEYTTSGSESDVPPNTGSSGESSSAPMSTSSSSSSTSSCEDNGPGSVINLQKREFETDQQTTPTTDGPNSGGSDPGAVRLRRKKRVVNRNWRASSSSIESCVGAKRRELSSLSEGALNLAADDRSAKDARRKLLRVDVTPRKIACGSAKRRSSLREQHQRRRRCGATANDGHAVVAEATVKCQSLISLLHSGSLDGGRWRCVDVAAPLTCGISTSDDDDEEEETLFLMDEFLMAKGRLNESTSSSAGTTAACVASTTMTTTMMAAGAAAAAASVSTIIDDLGSMSEQAWDDYQDPPYLSDAYSEKALDGDDAAVRRLLEFGDDYRAYMESGNASEGTSTPSLPVVSSSNTGTARDRTRRPAKPSNGITSIVASASSASASSGSRMRADPVLDSESDLDDLHDVVRRHRQQLDVTRQRFSSLKNIGGLSELSSGRRLISETAEVLATCETHIRCLKRVWTQLTTVTIRTDPQQQQQQHSSSSSSPSSSSSSSPSSSSPVLPNEVGIRQVGEVLRDDWQNLLMETKEFQRQLCQLGYLQNEVKQLKHRAMLMSAKVDEHLERASCLEDRSSFDLLLVAFKESCECLQDLKSCLGRANFEVHTFASQTGQDVSNVRADVVELYRLWDRSHERLQSGMVSMEKLRSLWNDYEARRDAILKIKLPRLVADGGCRAVKVDLEADLVAFRSSAGMLRMPLEPSPASESIGLETMSVVERVYAVLFNAVPPPSDSYVGIKERFADTSSVAVKMQTSKVPTKKGGATPVDSAASKKRPTNASSLLWRVLKAAVPFQLTLVVLFCLACFLEPHCCDNVNNLHYSLAPQLRYVRGPPPI